jgi:hypothetical protein
MPRKQGGSVVRALEYVIQRGNNRQVSFDGDMKANVTWLKQYADKFFISSLILRIIYWQSR